MAAPNQAHSRCSSGTRRGGGVCIPVRRAPRCSPRGRDRILLCCPTPASRARIYSAQRDRRVKAGKMQEREKKQPWLKGKRGQLQHLQTATYPPFFYLPRGHHNNASVLLPHHLPEVIDCGVQAALARNVGLGALVWADQIVLGVDRGRSGELQELAGLPPPPWVYCQLSKASP